MMKISSKATSNPDFAIHLEHLGKRYTIGHQKAKGDGIRHAIEGAMRAPLSWVRSRWQEKLQEVDFWALKDVSAEIKEGEIVGIVGKNGAGKSTLLKLLSRITVPTEGKIRINGRIASLLEVGTGFHGELTGRENIFLNGAILGMTRAEIIRKFDEIVAFSEIEEFLDTPVKRYSSGMYVRLAFAVAAHLDPEIMIVDEVLAVGDSAFQKKCLEKMQSFAQSGKTILFVSHNLDSVRALCRRALWIKDGHLHKDGPADEVLEEYFDSLTPAFGRSNPDYGLIIEKVIVKNGRGQETSQFVPSEDLVVEIFYEAEKSIENPVFAVSVLGVNGSCFASNMLLDGQWPDSLEGVGKITCTFKSIPLLPQNYTIKLSVRQPSIPEWIIPYQEVAYFSVGGDLLDYGYRGDFETYARYSTPVVIPYEWCLPDGKIVPVSLSRSSHVIRQPPFETLV